MRTALPNRVRLGTFEVDLRAGEVRDGEQKAILPEQAVRILRMLVEAGGNLVAREEIRKKLWPNDTVVEFDHSINTAMRNLRRALGDSPDEPKYIETIPRRGYRLLVPVERLEAGDDSSSADERLDADAKEPAAGVPPAFASGHLIGKKVSHYRVFEVLGAGGMGMLYKAEDLKLGRQVALKFLPEELAADTVALQRFEREARTASSLDHPNICTIYEVEEHEEQPFIVMQLLQGETLRDRLATLAAQQKKLPLGELLDIAVQICSGLQAAHTKGIVHRDIKPANIFLTSTGQVKILDFGLAKLVSATHEDESDGSQLELGGTAAAPQRAKLVAPDSTLTRLGVAMGTAGYMSPEQVRGEKLDVRTDIFSFGLVLYEMATGQRAFAGETAALVHSAIVNDAPAPVRQVNREVPSEVEAIINKTLEKNREQRYQTAEELRTELERLQNTANPVLAGMPPRSTGRHWSRWFGISLFAIVAVLALAWLGWHWLGTKSKLVQRQLTFNPPGNRVTAAAVSPDGKYVAYHDQNGLYLQSLDSGETHPVGLPGALPSGFYTGLFWFSGGGKLLADIDGKGLWVVPVSADEQPRRLYELASDPSISPDGRTIAFIHHTFESGQEGRHELWIGDMNGGVPRKLVTVDATEKLVAPVWSPDGHWIAYGRTWKAEQGRSRSAIDICSLGGARKTLLTDSSFPGSNAFDWYAAAWSSDWRLVFIVARTSKSPTEGSLWQVRIDRSTAQAVGNPEQVTKWEDSCCGNLSTTTDGKRLAFVKYRTWVDEYLAELSPDAASVKTPRSFLRIPPQTGGPRSWTSDGQFLIFDSAQSGRWEIFRRRPDDTAAEKLVAGPHDPCCAQTSPDGAWLLYFESSATQGSDTIWLMRRPSGGGPGEKVLEVSQAQLDNFRCRYNPNANSPCVLAMTEGENLVFYSVDPIKGKGRQLGKIDVLGFPWMRGWDLSPDGSRVAVVSLHKDRPQVESAAQIKFGARIDVLTLSDGSWHRISAEPADRTASAADQQLVRFFQVAWAADGKSFFVTAMMGDSVNLLRVTPDGKMHLLLGNESFQNQGFGNLLPSPNGKYLAFTSQVWEGNVWTIDNFR
jgi:serine/threonine protein kinase/Tol biopolymer transport system component